MDAPLPPDQIFIESLEVLSRVGVPDEELAAPQRLVIDAAITARISFESLGDDIASTVDYDAVCGTIRKIASSRPRRLIETLAADIASGVLAAHPAIEITISIRKFVVQGTDAVGVRCTRRAG